MQQDADEPAIGFETRLHPAARTGKFKKKGKCPVLNCTGEIDIDYTEEMVFFTRLDIYLINQDIPKTF